MKRFPTSIHVWCNYCYDYRDDTIVARIHHNSICSWRKKKHVKLVNKDMFCFSIRIHIYVVLKFYVFYIHALLQSTYNVYHRFGFWCVRLKKKKKTIIRSKFVICILYCYGKLRSIIL